MSSLDTSPLETFRSALQRDDLSDWVTQGLIGDGALIDGPFGAKPLIYADYVASGRALAQIEDFVRDQILPYYANSHSEASFCGAYVTRLRKAARTEIARLTGAEHGCSVVFAGSGATAGINRIVSLLDIAGITRAGGRAVVLVGPYEHHSNLLPWRESGAEVIEIAESATGGPDLADLAHHLAEAQGADLIVGTFSALSNVTGIVTDADAVTRLLKSHGALAVWDYAGGAPYVAMNMGQGDAAKDAIVFSGHKFPGGPGSSGAMIVRHDAVRRTTPTLPGGGTVRFVTPWHHIYSGDLAAREEGGTPNVVGDIRLALAMMVKDALGQEFLTSRMEALRKRARACWDKNSRIELLGLPDAKAVPIFSFRIRDGDGGYVHHQYFTRLLSDRFGIQARGGCACAGSYAHRLLGLNEQGSKSTWDAIEQGDEMAKPGWVRLNFSALMSDAKADAVIEAVDQLAREALQYQGTYKVDTATARFSPQDMGAQSQVS